MSDRERRETEKARTLARRMARTKKREAREGLRKESKK
jgi:hypothetical protein